MSAPKNGFQLHTKDTAPADSKPLMEKVEQGYGFVPNFFGVISESPAAAEAYMTLNQIFTGKSSLSAADVQVVLLTISQHNKCNYCVAAHTASAERTGLDAGTVQALREGGNLPDAKQDALATFTRKLIDKNGWVSEDDVKTFLDAGYTRQNLLDVILGLSMKTLSNYVNHIAETPVDGPLADKALDKAS
jgi:uncharacterized peroxidase-related enzyme